MKATELKQEDLSLFKKDLLDFLLTVKRSAIIRMIFIFRSDLVSVTREYLVWVAAPKILKEIARAYDEKV